MLDTTQKRGALIEHLQSALGLSGELGEDALGFLIERALDEAQGQQLVAIDKTKQS